MFENIREIPREFEIIRESSRMLERIRESSRICSREFERVGEFRRLLPNVLSDFFILEIPRVQQLAG
eukprot:1347695-Amorphochlora_amoeboformis.AAC.1